MGQTRRFGSDRNESALAPKADGVGVSSTVKKGEREPSQRAGHHAEAADVSTETATLAQLRERLATALTGEVS